MKFEKKTVYRAGSIFIVSVVISIAVFLSDRGAGLEKNQNGQVVLLREEHGKGNKTEKSPGVMRKIQELSESL